MGYRFAWNPTNCSRNVSSNFKDLTNHTVTIINKLPVLLARITPYAEIFIPLKYPLVLQPCVLRGFCKLASLPLEICSPASAPVEPLTEFLASIHSSLVVLPPRQTELAQNGESTRYTLSLLTDSWFAGLLMQVNIRSARIADKLKHAPYSLVLPPQHSAAA